MTEQFLHSALDILWLIWKQSAKWHNRERWIYYFPFGVKKSVVAILCIELANTCVSPLRLSRPGRYFKGCCGKWEARATSTALDDFQSQQQTPSSLLHPLICTGLVTDTRRNFSPLLLMDLIAGGLHSYAFVFANCVFFPPTSPAAKVKWHHVEKEVGLNIYPQGPAGEPGTDGRRRMWSTGGWDILPVARIWVQSSFQEALCGVLHLADWSVENICWYFDLMWIERGKDGRALIHTVWGEKQYGHIQMEKRDIKLSLIRRNLLHPWAQSHF